MSNELHVNAPKPSRTVHPSGSKTDRPGQAHAYARTPTFLRPLEDDEHEKLTALNKGIVQLFNFS